MDHTMSLAPAGRRRDMTWPHGELLLCCVAASSPFISRYYGGGRACLSLLSASSWQWHGVNQNSRNVINVTMIHRQRTT